MITPLERNAPSRPLALTMGDPAGIGPELALKAWATRGTENLSPFCIYACAATLRARDALLGSNVPIEVVASPGDAADAFERALPVIDVPVAEPVVVGLPSPGNGAATIAAITRAVEDVKSGHAAAIVTNPIAKSVLYAAGFQYPGHTEFLAALAGKHWPGAGHTAVMMLASDGLKVVPLTIHVPLASVPEMITRDLIETAVRITAESLRRDFGVPQPRIAIAGLNPHAGEDGTIGREEEDIIAPALHALRSDSVTLIGPLSADTMFHAAARATYDAAICMYHDQALIPIKTLAFDKGVNVTLGLPFIRTSPDHGTAFGIAARGTASAQSLIEALRLASRMVHARAKARV